MYKKVIINIVQTINFRTPIVAPFLILPASHNRKIESNVRKISRREYISIENIVLPRPKPLCSSAQKIP
jgi:hypothetical protein